MKKNKTEIILLVDRSGSMSTIKTDMEGALTTFLQKQSTLPGECLVSLYTFDTELERVVIARPIGNASQQVRIDPRGSTALYDAACETIDEVGARFAALPEAERPETVLFVIVTDGEENASRTFRETDVKKRIEHQRDVYKWDFSFLGANQDAILTARGLGVLAGKAINYSATKAGVGAVTDSLHTYASAVRCCSAGDSGGVAFSDTDRTAAVKN